jgi:hypothetical protein
MPNLLPTLFIVFGACALVLTLFWLWQSLRHTFAHAEEAQVAAETSSAPRAALLAEKKSLLMALKDLEAERDTGKLSETDFVELNARYRQRARLVLKGLDGQIAPHRDAAKVLLKGALETAAAPGVPAGAAGLAAPAAESGIAVDAAASPACPSCATANDADAAFCKKCGTKLQAAEASS